MVWGIAMRVGLREKRCEMKHVDLVTGVTTRCILPVGHDEPCDLGCTDGCLVHYEECPLSCAYSEADCADGSLVGIVHSMDEGGSPISPGQSDFQKGTRVRDRLGHPEKHVAEGCVLHYDASPGHEAAIVRWDRGTVTVELDLTTLEVIA
ncbi:hypothetical protein TPA2_gp68 [Tsukamurella phage TPA2]|uniref:hypothetical protein n=1 Tax=Tsukamurella phage TPA2 TaxID=981330 RepID=UPI0001FF8DDB|nr:hypothetical protein TPA2_gp68 [Tsukamurella phage TPA2]ADX31982.1 hypothetical protein [Tsukamurella phage TPA2]